MTQFVQQNNRPDGALIPVESFAGRPQGFMPKTVRGTAFRVAEGRAYSVVGWLVLQDTNEVFSVVDDEIPVPENIQAGAAAAHPNG